MPLPLLFYGNLLFGLGGTQALRYFLFDPILILIFHRIHLQFTNVYCITTVFNLDDNDR